MPPRTSTLTPLQRRILVTLAEIEPRWTLTGGGALAEAHLGHRATRDLDLFWHGLGTLPEPQAVVSTLEAAGFTVAVERRTPSFVQIRVEHDEESILVDLVADPVAVVSQPQEHAIEGRVILVDSAHEILVNKLCALLSRSALRDLIDVTALLQAGGDLATACRDANDKDSGFSIATLAWVLSDLPIPALARVAGLDETRAGELESQRQQLVMALAELARPQV